MTGPNRARASLEAAGISAARRLARRPRAWLRRARASRGYRALQHGTRRIFERGALAGRALAARPSRRAAWLELNASLAGLGPAPLPTRTVSIVVVVSTGADPPGWPELPPDVEVVVARSTGAETLAGAAARAARETRGELLCFLLASTTMLEAGTTMLEAGWLARLAAALDGTRVVAAAPLVVHPLRTALHATPHDGRVRSCGFELDVSDDAPIVRAREAGSAAVAGPDRVSVGGASVACLLVDRRAYDAAGALPDLDDIDLAAFELCRKLRAGGSAQVVVVSAAVAVDHRGVASRAALSAPISTETAAWRGYVEAHGPRLMREARPRPDDCLTIALTVAAPSEKVASRWGDWHLAEALARALRRKGHVVRVQTIDHADDLASRSCDVHCVVRGLQSVRRTSGQAHVLWVISHPESIGAPECDAADLVFVASVRFAAALRELTHTPVEVLLQATDAERFHPVAADAEHAHDVAIVAKSRNVYRAAVSDAVAAGIRPAIYGSGWEAFVDPGLVVRQYVPNEELPTVYSSVGVLLNDHWQSMHDWGFVSNRLFDALACGTPVISEELAELDELFAGAVLTYRNVDELRDLVASTLADRDAARARAALGLEIVHAHHTFDHRAQEFLDALHRHAIV